MIVSTVINAFSSEEGLTFLELLAHNLTIGVRMAASQRQPEGPLTDDETRLAMYWINEALHNVVQLTRKLRLNPDHWSYQEISQWIDLWQRYRHGTDQIEWAVRHSIEELRSH